jgi:hypothetical protein
MGDAGTGMSIFALGVAVQPLVVRWRAVMAAVLVAVLAWRGPLPLRASTTSVVSGRKSAAQARQSGSSGAPPAGRAIRSGQCPIVVRLGESLVAIAIARRAFGA